MNIVFFPVKDSSSKLSRLHQTAHIHLAKKEPLLFLVPDKASFDFLDRLLWSSPAEGFLPHPSSLLTIALQLDAHFPTVFNLRPIPLIEPGIKTVYEFEDHTSSEKFQLSKQRYQGYRAQKFPISIEM